MVCAIVELGSCSVFLAGNLSKLKLTPIRRLTIITDRLSVTVSVSGPVHVCTVHTCVYVF